MFNDCFFHITFFLTTFFKKHFKVRIFKIDPTSVKQHQIFLSAAKGAVASSGSDSSLLFLFSNVCW